MAAPVGLRQVAGKAPRSFRLVGADLQGDCVAAAHGATCMSARKSEPAPVGRAESSRYQLRVALILSMKEIVTAMGQRSPTSWYKESPNLVLTFEASHDYCTRSKRANLRSNCWLACPDYASRVGSDKETWRRSDI